MEIQINDLISKYKDDNPKDMVNEARITFKQNMDNLNQRQLYFNLLQSTDFASKKFLNNIWKMFLIGNTDLVKEY